MMPRPGAAKGVVPKNGIGIAFWIDGVPGRADMVKVEVPSTIAAGINQHQENRRGAKQRAGHRNDDEERDEQADAAIGDQRPGEHDREDHAPLAETLRHEARDRCHRPAVVHQLAEYRAEQKDRKELREKPCRIHHEDLGPGSRAAARHRTGRPPAPRRGQAGGRSGPGTQGGRAAEPERMPRRPTSQHSSSRTSRSAASAGRDRRRGR